MRNCVQGVGKGYSWVLMLLILTFSVHAQQTEICTFVEKGGIVTVEMESAEYNGTSWIKNTGIPGYTGSGYLQYTGSMVTGVPGKSMLTYSFRITEPGRYSFKTRAYRENFTDNDVWVRFPQGGVITSYEGDTTAFLNDSWFKYMLGAQGQWNYFMKTQTVGYKHSTLHDIYVDFPEPGLYTVEFSGRSTGFSIDRFVLYKTSGFYGMDPKNAESERENCISRVPEGPYLAGSLVNISVIPGEAFSFSFADTVFRHYQNLNLDFVSYQRGVNPIPAWLQFNKSTRTFFGAATAADSGEYYIVVKAQDINGAYAIGEYKLTVGITTGITGLRAKGNIAENFNAAGMDVFPNPGVENISFKAQNAEIYTAEVFDMHGRKVLEAFQVLSDAKMRQLESLNNGVYILNISDKEGEFIKSIRFVKR